MKKKSISIYANITGAVTPNQYAPLRKASIAGAKGAAPVDTG